MDVFRSKHQEVPSLVCCMQCPSELNRGFFVESRTIRVMLDAWNPNSLSYLPMYETDATYEIVFAMVYNIPLCGASPFWVKHEEAIGINLSNNRVYIRLATRHHSRTCKYSHSCHSHAFSVLLCFSQTIGKQVEMALHDLEKHYYASTCKPTVSPSLLVVLVDFHSNR